MLEGNYYTPGYSPCKALLKERPSLYTRCARVDFSFTLFSAAFYNPPMPKTIATAESCTGGLLGVLLTDKPGASKYYRGSVVAYHDRIKKTLLGVPASTLRNYGAVSAQTAEKMAQGVRKKFRADIGVSITGIAGPDGETKEKPVGLVYIALSDKTGTRSKRFLFSGGRARVRSQAARKALAWLKLTA